MVRDGGLSRRKFLQRVVATGCASGVCLQSEVFAEILSGDVASTLLTAKNGAVSLSDFLAAKSSFSNGMQAPDPRLPIAPEIRVMPIASSRVIPSSAVSGSTISGSTISSSTTQPSPYVAQRESAYQPSAAQIQSSVPAHPRVISSSYSLPAPPPILPAPPPILPAPSPILNNSRSYSVKSYTAPQTITPPIDHPLLALGGNLPAAAHTPVHAPQPTVHAPQPTTAPARTAAKKAYPVKKRKSWTSQGVARPERTNKMGGIKFITIHHDGMPPVRLTTEKAIRRRIENIRASHVSHRKWADIGYHYIIDPMGLVWEGRPDHLQGAHAEGWNEHNLGVMVLGHFGRQVPTAAALKTLFGFITAQRSVHRIPAKNVITHKEVQQTACPGKYLQSEISKARGKSGPLARS